jgi:hypothetical protein
MNLFRRQGPLGPLAVTLALAFATVHCGSDTPTQPTTNPAVSAVALNPASTAVGTSVQGVVTLTVAAPTTGTTVSLSSSNATVATVPLAVTVPAASTTASFAVSAMAPGTTTITATFSGSSKSATLTVTTVAAPSFSISLNPTSVVGGNPVTGTVTLSSGAPAGGAVVTLSGGDPVILPTPPTVTVAAGATTATFTLATKAVTEAAGSTITGAYGGATATANLSVTPPVTAATARFGVSGTNVTDTCQMAANGANLECTFDGSSSTAPGTIVSWEWTYSVATTIAQTTATPVLSMPSASCALLPAPPLPAGTTSFPLRVTLTVRDNLGNVSAVATDSGARVLPQGACGFAP